MRYDMATESHTMARNSHTRPAPASRSKRPPRDAVTVQAKGQVTITQRVRDELGVEPGDEVTWVKNREGRFELWTQAEFDRFWEEASVGLAEHLKRSRAGLHKSFARRMRQLEAMAKAEAD